PSHCVSDLVERVAFTVGERDLREGIYADGSGNWQRAFEPGDPQEMRAARGLVYRWREIRQQLRKCLDDCGIERFAGVLLENANRRLRSDRAPVRPLGRDG